MEGEAPDAAGLRGIRKEPPVLVAQSRYLSTFSPGKRSIVRDEDAGRFRTGELEIRKLWMVGQ
jgi:hypothetical protein